MTITSGRRFVKVVSWCAVCSKRGQEHDLWLISNERQVKVAWWLSGYQKCITTRRQIVQKFLWVHYNSTLFKRWIATKQLLRAKVAWTAKLFEEWQFSRYVVGIIAFWMAHPSHIRWRCSRCLEIRAVRAVLVTLFVYRVLTLFSLNSSKTWTDNQLIVLY